MSFQNVQTVYPFPSASLDYDEKEEEERNVVVDFLFALDEVLLLLLLRATFSYTQA